MMRLLEDPRLMKFCDRCHRRRHRGKCIGASADPDLRADLQLERAREAQVFFRIGTAIHRRQAEQQFLEKISAELESAE